MRLTVASIIARARAKMRSPSEAQLAREVLRFLLHEIAEPLNAKSAKLMRDVFVHEGECTLTYSEDSRAFEVSVEIGGTPLTHFDAFGLFYQSLAADPETDSWDKVRKVPLDALANATHFAEPVGTFIGNVFDGAETEGHIYLKTNMTQSYVSTRRFRLAVQRTPQGAYGYTDFMPFVPEYTSLLTTRLAEKGLPLVKDDSPGFQRFMATQLPLLRAEGLMLEEKFDEWISQDVEPDYVRQEPFNYKGRATRRELKIEV